MIGSFSGKLARQPGLAAILGEEIVHLRSASDLRHGIHALVGWGLRPTTNKPRKLADRLGLPFISLEDGFVRSWGTGKTHPALSFVVDHKGIYYAGDRTSDLESLLNSDTDLLEASSRELRDSIINERFSKYNSAPRLSNVELFAPGRRVLVVDQTRSDASITYGLSDADSFRKMLESAKIENPGSTIYVKTHPEVYSGTKRGYYDHMRTSSDVVLLRDAVNPLDLIALMDKVYVVTSQLGFEALLMGKPVTCFGMPWYAGWGVTEDRLTCSRRNKKRSVDELFSAAYLNYTKYLNPWTHEPGGLRDVLDWLRLQREMSQKAKGRTIAIGYKRWKAENVRPFLSLDPAKVHFVREAKEAAAQQLDHSDRLVVWGIDAPAEVKLLAQREHIPLLHMEDGFVRSIGLGSDFIPPISLVMDSNGIYFDPRRPSTLETILNTYNFTEADRERAASIRQFINNNHLTKYNIEPHTIPIWANTEKEIILVPGQVEDDASIRYGCTTICTNVALLATVRQHNPEAYIVYKPHPDVLAKNRVGRVHTNAALKYADKIELQASIVSCIEASQQVHTMTSLSGFDALLRGKKVAVYGRPFYAGWGLTDDKLSIARRNRKLALDELVSGTLIQYPVYRDWVLNGYTNCESALKQLVRQRNILLNGNGLQSVRMTYVERQWHKFRLWAKAGFLMMR